MTDNEVVFSGGFRKLYLVVKALALYAGTFFLCYFWPLFIAYLLAPPGNSQSEAVAGVLITPLGFLVLGSTQGKVTAIAHVVLLLLAAGGAFALYPSAPSDPVQDLLTLWTPLMLVTYAIGFGFGVRRQLQKF